MHLTGAQIIVQFLKDEGVEYVFGYPGGSVLHLYDALYQQNHVKHILVRHEQGATHMADGFARATGKPGVAVVTSGPGVTNAVTGIATAYMDSVPLVVISGQVARNLIGNDAFQEVDCVGITRPCVKHNFLVQDIGELASTLKKAFHVATTGRPGPVVVDIPKDITAEATDYQYPATVKMRSYNPVVTGHIGQIRRALDLIVSAERPMLYTGGGVVLDNAAELLTTFARLLGVPITNTLMGLGAFPGTDPQFLGMLGMHGTYEANMAMHECDVLIAIGARFDDRITGDLESFCPYARIVHVDIDPSSIAKNVRVDVPIVGSVASVLTEFVNQLQKSERRPNPEALEAWWRQIEKWRSVESLRYEHSDTVIKPQYVLEKLYEITKGEAFVTSDVGQHQMWTAQYYKFAKPRRWINSGGLGTMGFGMPAALGVKFAYPDETVVCVTGDGSIQMCIQELSTAKQHNLPIKIISLNNRYLGMIRQWQEFFYDNRYSQSYLESLPDFVKLVESYGHVGMHIEKPADVEGALREALAMEDRLVFMEFITDSMENVYPMMAAGRAHDEMLLSQQSRIENLE
ncbi:MAG: biosynthetic-type acetolactate synthase large subunit [Gammaproteobacteria bacterium]|nr:biosynthetic-type acetolactate synthase large subunit [Gammaproteobacteria bacterium]NNJ83501.1 biosynthetic-type acetolactate synthase large subunit [Gammaproteobacteria bacterium]